MHEFTRVCYKRLETEEERNESSFKMKFAFSLHVNYSVARQKEAYMTEIMTLLMQLYYLYD